MSENTVAQASQPPTGLRDTLARLALLRRQPLFILALLAACLYLAGLAFRLFWLKLLAKPLPVVALAVAVWRHTNTAAGHRIALGLMAGAVGDVCLVLPNAFLPGMIAFAIGHGLYIAAFLQWSSAPALLLMVPVGAFTGMALWLLLPGAGSLALPLVVYVLVIGAMIWRAAACSLEAQSYVLLRWGPLAGAVLFAASDLAIGFSRFRHYLPGAAYPIILTYWAAQALFAATAIRASGCDADPEAAETP